MVDQVEAGSREPVFLFPGVFKTYTNPEGKNLVIPDHQ
jgi:hypothetical protein